MVDTAVLIGLVGAVYPIGTFDEGRMATNPITKFGAEEE